MGVVWFISIGKSFGPRVPRITACAHSQEFMNNYFAVTGGGDVCWLCRGSYAAVVLCHSLTERWMEEYQEECVYCDLCASHLNMFYMRISRVVICIILHTI